MTKSKRLHFTGFVWYARQTRRKPIKSSSLSHPSTGAFSPWRQKFHHQTFTLRGANRTRSAVLEEKTVNNKRSGESHGGKLLNGQHSADKRSCHFRFLNWNIISRDELTYYANRAVVMTYTEICLTLPCLYENQGRWERTARTKLKIWESKKINRTTWHSNDGIINEVTLGREKQIRRRWRGDKLPTC